VRQEMKSETRQFTMKTTSSETFMQTREVPIGSNWPGKGANDAPKPSVVAIRKTDGGNLID
jgi:uncharacterized protein